MNSRRNGLKPIKPFIKKAIFAGLFGWAAIPVGAQDAVILLYHHVSDSTPAITSIGPGQFEEQLQYLEENSFNLLGLEEIFSALEQGQQLPERSVAISFDDAYESVYQNAYPLLKSRNWPFSLFVASDSIDQNYQGYMTWQQLREIQQYGAEIGGHSASHAHLVRALENESLSQWSARVSADIDRGNRRIKEEVGVDVRFFAYPYGEFNPELKQMLMDRSIYALAQYSGAIGPTTDLYEAPRYPIAQGYAGMQRFALITSTRALPVTEVDAGALIRRQGEPEGEFSFTLLEGDYQKRNLACFSSDGQSLQVQQSDNRVSVSLPVFTPGRNKVNCTAPANSEPGVYFWFSRQWLVKTASGDWPQE